MNRQMLIQLIDFHKSMLKYTKDFYLDWSPILGTDSAEIQELFSKIEKHERCLKHYKQALEELNKQRKEQ